MEEHPQARYIVETLFKAGFIAYYAGGWVRDLLLKHPSDDIDIATNAPPETIQALFPHTIPVGIAFGILIVVIEGHHYEVATFRRDLDYRDGRRPSAIAFATPIEDARRRDFTINGMFYDPRTGEILDFVNGKADLEAKLIRAIGDPHQRIKEDRLRMIRAIRLSCRFGFRIEEETARAIFQHASELFPAVAIERVWQELVKGHDFGKLRPMLIELHRFSLLPTLFPSLSHLPLGEIEKRLSPLDAYPKEAPVIASLLPLFPDSSLEEALSLCKKMKLSNQDLQFVTLLYRARALSQKSKEVEAVEWAYFYADPLSSLCLTILSASLNPPQKTLFFQEHNLRKEQLGPSIERIQKKTPVLRSSDLFAAGIQPGIAMGMLLKEAERISINEQIDRPEPLIEQLKKSPLWPPSSSQ